MISIPTTHAGSLVRPHELINHLRAIDAGAPYDEAAYEECLRRSVRDVVAKQVRAGIDIVSDGEYGKSAWDTYLYERLGGVELRPQLVDLAEMVTHSTDWSRFPEFYVDYFATQQELDPPAGVYAAVGEITYRGQAAIARDIANLIAAMEAAGASEGFLPVVAPASAFPGLIDEHFGSEAAALMAVAEALAVEYRAVIDAGLYLQVDDASLPFMHDILVPPATMDEYRRWAQMRIDALNHALEGLPRERVRYHVCWGSWNGPHTNDLPLEDVLPMIFQVNAGTYLVENANPAHEHEWRVWEQVELPEGTKLAPGVITHATNIVEHPRLVAERLERIGRLIGPENLLASTDCGFAQGPYVARTHDSIVWAKLAALSEGAALAAERLALR